MKRKHLDPQRVVLIPADDDALEIGVGVAPDGQLGASLTITTATLGQFVVPLTAAQLAVLAVVSKKLLTLDAQQVQALRDELTRANNEEGDTDE